MQKKTIKQRGSSGIIRPFSAVVTSRSTRRPTKWTNPPGAVSHGELEGDLYKKWAIRDSPSWRGTGLKLEKTTKHNKKQGLLHPTRLHGHTWTRSRLANWTAPRLYPWRLEPGRLDLWVQDHRFLMLFKGKRSGARSLQVVKHLPDSILPF